jgi:hypothetical protein
MSATPIPRTLAMTVYADLDVSIVDELPPGRTAVRTVVLPEQKRAQIVERIDAGLPRRAPDLLGLSADRRIRGAQCAGGRGDRLALTEALPARRVELLHGRMPPKQKDQIMQRFVAGETQLLVATTVIEVGVDVPNASLMVIENAERMGLAQLHQLRGRVGRGEHESSCVLLYRAPLSPMARARLATIRDSNDGFASRSATWSCAVRVNCWGNGRPASRSCGSRICRATPICSTDVRAAGATDRDRAPSAWRPCGCAGSVSGSSMDASAELPLPDGEPRPRTPRLLRRMHSPSCS